MREYLQFYIDGKWVDPVTPNTLDVINPALEYSYRSEREEWIQSMILAGLGIAFLPEYLTLYPGLPTRVIIDPEVTRDVKLVTVAGRRFSPAVREFVRLSRSYDWAA